MGAAVLTPIGVLNFPNFFKASPRNIKDPNSKLAFGGMLLLDSNAVNSTAYANLKAAVFNAAVDKFGAAKVNDPNFMKSMKSPLRPASEKDYNGFDQGEIFFAPWSPEDQKPGVVDINGQDILVPGDVWSGQLARFTVKPFGYDTSGNRGVGLILEHVQIVKADMPRLDGRQSTNQAFNAKIDDAQLKALGIDMNAANSNVPPQTQTQQQNASGWI